jgi:hypothetical protein
MFLFSNLFLIAPFGLPGIGSGAVAKRIGGIKDIFGVVALHLDYFLLFLVALIFLFIIFRIYRYVYKFKLRKIEILIYRLYSEILLLDKMKKSAKIGKSEKETVSLVLDRLDSWWIKKILGKHNRDRVVDALVAIKTEKLDLQSSLMLVANWQKMLGWLISNL